jgi:hypothetical protein
MSRFHRILNLPIIEIAPSGDGVHDSEQGDFTSPQDSSINITYGVLQYMNII